MKVEDLEPINEDKLRVNHSGKKNNLLTIIKPVGKYKKNGVYYLCECTCGKTIITRGCDVISGTVKSCGCLRDEANKTRNISHGLSKTPEYYSWCHMKGRCYNLKNKDFKRYGGRGIKVCDSWLDAFENFYKDMGMKPSKEYTLDRINNDEGYSPSNCRWATRKQQARNLSTNRLVTHNNKTKCISEWAEETGVPASTISARLNKLNWKNNFIKGE